MSGTTELRIVRPNAAHRSDSTNGSTIICQERARRQRSSRSSVLFAGDVPTIDLAIGYNRANDSPILKRFLSHLDELIARVWKEPV